jgi:hypothetical protein
MSKLQNPLYELLRADGYVNISKALMFAIGNDEALIYSELLSRYAYFAEKGDLNDYGYFYNTVEDLWSGTNLSDYKQRAAIASLKRIGLISIQVRGIPPKRFFRIENNPELLAELIVQGREKARRVNKDANSQKTSELILKKLQINNNKNNENDFGGELGILTAVGQSFKNQKKWRNRPLSTP